MEITALATSRHVTQDYGSLRCVGRYHKAINFLTEKDQLLTLHRVGCGLSPMGWQIDDTAFDHVLLRLPATGRSSFSGERLLLGGINISRRSARLNLALERQSEIPLWPLSEALSRITAQCGLFGRIDQQVTQPLCPEVGELSRKFSCWLRGDQVDWDSAVGKGPGLTPSNDDSLLGMLLSAHLDGRVAVVGLAPFFQRTAALSGLTTLVSAHYLHYAEQGIFATPLHGLAQGLLTPEALPLAIDEVLRLGHFSGADTLLGVWLGVMAINDLH